MTSWLQDYRVQEYSLPSPPSFKCNVLRESLSADNQNIFLRNIKEKGVVGNLYICLVPSLKCLAPSPPTANTARIASILCLLF
jgi:hypothetical protein